MAEIKDLEERAAYAVLCARQSNEKFLHFHHAMASGKECSTKNMSKKVIRRLEGPNCVF